MSGKKQYVVTLTGKDATKAGRSLNGSGSFPNQFELLGGTWGDQDPAGPLKVEVALEADGPESARAAIVAAVPDKLSIEISQADLAPQLRRAEK